MLDINKPILLTDISTLFFNYNFNELGYTRSVILVDHSRLVDSLSGFYDPSSGKEYRILYVDKSNLQESIDAVNKVKDNILNLQPNDKVAIELMKELTSVEELKTINTNLDVFTDEVMKQKCLDLINYTLNKLNEMKTSNELVVLELNTKLNTLLKFPFTGYRATKRISSREESFTLKLSEKDKIYTFKKSTPKYEIINYFNSLIHCLFADQEGII